MNKLWKPKSPPSPSKSSGSSSSYTSLTSPNCLLNPDSNSRSSSNTTTTGPIGTVQSHRFTTSSPTHSFTAHANETTRSIVATTTRTSSLSSGHRAVISTATAVGSSSSPWRMPYSTGFLPRSRAEQYWAARALSAETLLAAKMEHYRDISYLKVGEEEKRNRELAALTKANEKKVTKLEKLVLALLTIFIVFTCVLFVAYTHITSSHYRRDTRSSHFTIPILSPFASVVEHEVSVIGTKTITALCVVLSALAYFVFRHWIGRAQSSGSGSGLASQGWFRTG